MRQWTAAQQGFRSPRRTALHRQRPTRNPKRAKRTNQANPNADVNDAQATKTKQEATQGEAATRQIDGGETTIEALAVARGQKAQEGAGESAQLTLQMQSASPEAKQAKLPKTPTPPIDRNLEMTQRNGPPSASGDGQRTQEA